MKSAVVKRSIAVAEHKTSVSMEDAFWNLLKEIAEERDQTVKDLDDRFHETAQLRFGLRPRKMRLFRRPHMIRTLEALD